MIQSIVTKNKKEMKKYFNFFVSIMLTVLAFVMGGAGNVMIAASGTLPDGGTSDSGVGNIGNVELDSSGDPTGNITQDGEGIATETGGRNQAAADGNDEFYLNDVDKNITKIRPMSTPIDQISRYANTSKTDSFICKYYSVGTRPIKTTTTEAVSAQTTGTQQSFVLKVADPTIFTKDDTIRVVGVKGINDYKGTAYTTTYGAGSPKIPDLVLCVCGRQDTTNYPVVYCVNGYADTNGQNVLPPAIANGSTIIRMGKACGELDVQTGRFNNMPKPDFQYCQNFMIQIEQSTFDKLAAKEVNWGFSDQEQDALFDMRLTQELAELFGDMNKIEHISKEGMAQWFTKGIWWMPNQDRELGHWDTTSDSVVIGFDDLVDFMKAVTVGSGTGNKKKILIGGSDVVAALSKIDTDTIRRTSGTVVKWNLEFTSIRTGFGELLLIHHELFDLCGMGKEALLLDPEYLSKRVHLSWQRNVLDLKKAGIRNSDAVVLQEVACLYLRYPNAHARVALATEPEEDDTEG